LEQTYLKQLLEYNSQTGEFFWKIRRSNCAKHGWFSGTKRPDGYLAISIDKKIYLAHKLAWLWVYGELPPILDHIDEDKGNNKINNLRLSSKSLNGLNQAKPHKDSTQIFRGISQTDSGKWMAKYCVDNKQIYLGSFETQEEASQVYHSHKEVILANG